MLFFFFFKQKTAYEMRISDWSSGVCSSDLTQYTEYDGADGVRLDNIFKRAAFALRFADGNPLISNQITGDSKILYMRDIRERVEALAPFLHFRSEEHTSELQSLMRISYAVFCLQ